MTGTSVKASVKVLLSGLIDYAGLYPPSQLSMKAALENMVAYRDSTEGWILGRFVVGSSRLEECIEVLTALKPGAPVSLSVLMGSTRRPSDIPALVEFNQRYGDSLARITAIESKLSAVGDATEIARAVGDQFVTYCEIPLTGDAVGMISETAEAGLRAKVRTGGITPETIPGASDIVRFIYACAAKRVPFKSTAGLHHPLRGSYALTYEPGATTGVMHGFLNLFLTAAFLVEGVDVADAMQLMEETDPGTFVFDDRFVRWRTHEISVDRLVMVRRGFAIAFGSCSFIEPVMELRQLGLL